MTSVLEDLLENVRERKVSVGTGTVPDRRPVWTLSWVSSSVGGYGRQKSRVSRRRPPSLDPYGDLTSSSVEMLVKIDRTLFGPEYSLG